MNRYMADDGILVTYNFVSDGINTIYQRSYFNVIDALGKIGGTYSSMVSAGALACAIFSYRLMMSSLIGQLFHFHPRFASEIVSKKKKPTGSSSPQKQA